MKAEFSWAIVLIYTIGCRC